MPAPALQIQTMYAELLERTAAGAFAEQFQTAGDFVRKTVRGRRYWYFQSTESGGRTQKYIGPETPKLLERIAQHKTTRRDRSECRSLVSTLIRAFGAPRPSPEIGRVTQALAKAGVFRLRSVLVGTTAFQTYAPMLGVQLGGAQLRTDDVDIAQFRDVSIAVNDRTSSALDILRDVDPSFRAVPHSVDGRKVTRYQATGGLRVDFLTPNRGRETSAPQFLPALRTDAEPLRFLDFLIYQPEEAVVLYDTGVPVLVPAPERYAVHKLIVSRRRSSGNPKRDKDLRQAALLLAVLAEKRPFELQEAWREARSRGRVWRNLIDEATMLLPERAREITLGVVQAGATSRRR